MAGKWSRCPSCGGNAVAITAIKSDLVSKYGLISAAAFIKAADEARDRIDDLKTSEELTLRETIEIGIVGKIFTVSYSSACSRCDFRYSFGKEVNVLEKGTVDPVAR